MDVSARNAILCATCPPRMDRRAPFRYSFAASEGSPSMPPAFADASPAASFALSPASAWPSGFGSCCLAISVRAACMPRLSARSRCLAELDFFFSVVWPSC